MAFNLTNVTNVSEITTRMQEIIDGFAKGNLSKALYDELEALKSQKDQANQERAGNINEIATAIRNLGLSFDELMSDFLNNQSVFSKDEILQYCSDNHWMAKAPKVQVEEEGEKKQRKPRTLREGVLLFSIQPMNAKGAPSKIYKGDAFPIQGIGAKMIWLAQQEGDLKTNLLAHKDNNEEAVAYLATEEGMAETQKWVDWIAQNAGNKPAEETTEETVEPEVQQFMNEGASTEAVAETVTEGAEEEQSHGKKKIRR